jgi:hypothetical protein
VGQLAKAAAVQSGLSVAKANALAATQASEAMAATSTLWGGGWCCREMVLTYLIVVVVLSISVLFLCSLPLPLFLSSSASASFSALEPLLSVDAALSPEAGPPTCQWATMRSHFVNAIATTAGVTVDRVTIVAEPTCATGGPTGGRRRRLRRWLTPTQVRAVFMIHVGGTRCVTSRTDNIMNIRARITLTVECIRTCIFFLCKYNYE